MVLPLWTSVQSEFMLQVVSFPVLIMLPLGIPESQAAMTAPSAGFVVVWHMVATPSISVSFARLDRSERWEVAAQFVVGSPSAPSEWARCDQTCGIRLKK